MHQPEEKINQAFVRIPNKLSPRGILRLSWMVLCCLAVSVLPAGAVKVQSLVTTAVDTAKVTPLVQHHPNWATSTNLVAMVDDQEDFEQMTLVLTRPASQQAAFEQLLADQQNPASPSYHKWLTAAEIGERFGVSDADLAAVTGWLTGQGLHVNQIMPDRTMIQFGGTASNLGHTFHTTLNYYNLHGEKRLATATEPSIPLALSPVIKAIRGLFNVGEHPLHTVSQLSLPEYTSSASGAHYLAPGDFNTIYNIPPAYTGAGVTIGIVGWSRVSTTDLTNYRSMTSTTFPNPTEVIPTAYHGVDPGTACTSTSCSATQKNAQSEATLDVIRSGSTAPGASLLLVASTAAATGSNDGIGADTQYLVYTSPVPAQIISISFGACEASASANNVAFWDNLFSTAAGEGISVFVSSGDSAAAGCDDAFSSPPGAIVANSPNYICSSQYATCVGGTQFADTTSPSTYWRSSNGTGYTSALGYIPEGGWNESSTTSVIGTGGGVSTIVATPTWQNVTGVPSARAGRYTPDISFSSSGHNGYLACMASAGTDCVSTITLFSGTSAAAPSMAGIAALLDQKLSGGQGNLNPRLYATYVAAPSAFHDTTVSTSGVSSCSVNTPSICNSSIYYTTGGAVQPGFLLTTGFDQVTGLGSLDVTAFLNVSNAIAAPTVTLTPASTSITSTQSLSVTIVAAGSSGNPTGSVTVSNGTYTSSAATLSSGTATIVIPAGSLASGTTSLTATYTPDSGGSISYSSATSTAVSVTVTKGTPTVTVTPTPSTIVSSQSLSVVVAVSAGSGTATVTATGTVTLTSGSYSSAATPLSSGTATIVVPAGTFAIGTATLSASYTPDTAGATFYNAATGSSSVTVAKTAPTVTVSASPSSITILQGTTVTVSVSGGTGNPTASGTVTLTSGTYTSSAATLSAGAATIAVPAGALAAGSPTVTATYTPDTTAATTYATATGTTTLTVSKVTPTVTVTPSSGTIAVYQALSVLVSVSGGSGATTASGSVVLTGGGYTSPTATLSAGGATITIPASSLTAASSVALTATYTPDTAGAATYNATAGSGSVTVTSLSATSNPTTVTQTKGGSSTATITVSPSYGFTGSVTLTASITSSPSGAQYAPTLSFGATSPVTISGTTPATATLTITTTAASTAALEMPARPGTHGGSGLAATGGALLACLLLFGIPARRRAWRNLVGLLALAVALMAGASACGGGSKGSTSTTIPGTTAGSYTITVYGNSYAIGTINLTVQ